MSEDEELRKPFPKRLTSIVFFVLGIGDGAQRIKAQSNPNGKPQREIQVLVLGLGRCGASSNKGGILSFLQKAMREALKIMGYRPNDSPDRFLAGHDAFWAKALRAKFYIEGPKWGREEFDKVLMGYDSRLSTSPMIMTQLPPYPPPPSPSPTRKYSPPTSPLLQAVLDTPCSFFSQELITAYPSALIILNTRPARSWLSSMRSSIFAVHAWPSWKLLQYTDPKVTGSWYPARRLDWEIFFGGHDHDEEEENCINAFERHYEHVRQVCSEERLFELDVSRGDGWGPLCEFLGKEVPKDEGFPRVNDMEGFFRRQAWLWWYGVVLSVINVGKIVGVIGVTWSVWAGLGKYW
ncbi:MAG: hypothetical protein Q9220_002416 [cf. Caloplaca sp. 1 TL-2023]